MGTVTVVLINLRDYSIFSLNEIVQEPRILKQKLNKPLCTPYITGTENQETLYSFDAVLIRMVTVGFIVFIHYELKVPLVN